MIQNVNISFMIFETIQHVKGYLRHGGLRDDSKVYLVNLKAFTDMKMKTKQTQVLC